MWAALIWGPRSPNWVHCCFSFLKADLSKLSVDFLSFKIFLFLNQHMQCYSMILVIENLVPSQFIFFHDTIRRAFHFNPFVPSKPHYGHCYVGNANNTKSVKNWSANFWSSDLWIYNTHLLGKENFKFGVVQLSKYLWAKGKNTANTWKYSKYRQIQLMYYAVFLLFGSLLSCVILFFWIV